MDKPVNKKYASDDKLPTVTLIIAAFNESAVIEEKIQNALALNYPNDKLQIIIFSDGSTDDTDARVMKYTDQGIKLLRVENRMGKTYCQNTAVESSTGGILVFSDANSMYEPSAIKELVANFNDHNVGVVCGQLSYHHEAHKIEGMYWAIEYWMKKWESAIDSCLGANGSMYAVRRSLYKNLSRDAISDFIQPFKVYEQGYRVIFDASAICYESAQLNHREFKRKRRIISRTLNSLVYIRSVLNPFRFGWYSIVLWSHKILRWAAFVPLIGLLISNIFFIGAGSWFLNVFLILQGVCYISAIIGSVIHRKPFSIPYYFLVVYTASCCAIADWLLGRKVIVWGTRS